VRSRKGGEFKTEHVEGAAADSCAGVTAYCSVSFVGYDISCGKDNP
jgi:hypothetical protein